MFDTCMKYNLTENINNCILNEMFSWIPYLIVFLLGFAVGLIFMKIWIDQTCPFKHVVLD
jgi:hypothetical protein